MRFAQGRMEDESLDGCALESIRVHQRSIMLRHVTLSPSGKVVFTPRSMPFTSCLSWLTNARSPTARPLTFLPSSTISLIASCPNSSSIQMRLSGPCFWKAKMSEPQMPTACTWT